MSRRGLVVMTASVAVALSGLVFTLMPGAPEPLRLTEAGTSYSVTVVFDRASTGTTDVRVETASSVAAVSLSAAMSEMGHLTPEVTARQEEPGRFSARGELFTMPGLWELAVRLRGPSGVEVITVDVPVDG